MLKPLMLTDVQIQTLMLTDVQAPSLGTPLAPPKQVGLLRPLRHAGRGQPRHPDECEQPGAGPGGPWEPRGGGGSPME